MSGKDISKLNEVSKLFTEEILKNVIAKAKNSDSKNICVSSWDFGNANKKGDSYLSTVNKVTVKGSINNNPVEVKIVVKALPNNIGRRKTYRSIDFFQNEIAFYSEVIPRFEEFLKEKKQLSLLNVPKCLAYLRDGENDFIVLEDASLLGYVPLERQTCLDIEQINLILKSLAKFHAISFAYKDQRKDFNLINKAIFETYFRKDLWDWYGKFHTNVVNITKDALAKEYPGSDAEIRFNSYKNGDFYKKSSLLCTLIDEKSSVINHGDCWVPNFLICNDKIMILDFQLTRCTSPILDISFLIYTCTDKILRDQHFDKMLKVYYNELNQTISKLGSNPDNVYSYDFFMKEVKDYFFHGVTFSMEAIPFSVLEETETFDLDVIQGDSAVNIADIWTLSNIKTKEHRLRLANIIVEATEKNFI